MQELFSNSFDLKKSPKVDGSNSQSMTYFLKSLEKMRSKSSFTFDIDMCSKYRNWQESNREQVIGRHGRVVFPDQKESSIKSHAGKPLVREIEHMKERENKQPLTS